MYKNKKKTNCADEWLEWQLLDSGHILNSIYNTCTQRRESQCEYRMRNLVITSPMHYSPDLGAQRWYCALCLWSFVKLFWKSPLNDKRPRHDLKNELQSKGSDSVLVSILFKMTKTSCLCWNIFYRTSIIFYVEATSMLRRW